MRLERLKVTILVALASFALFAFISPLELALNTDSVFEDPAKERMREESLSENFKGQLILKIRHDDNLSVTSNFAIFQQLLQLEHEFKEGTNPETAWDSQSTKITKLETPFQSWEEAFSSRNRSLTNATKWSDVLQPTIEGGWCGNSSTNEEKSAFQKTLLLLPKDSNFGIVCPSFPGADERMPPAADEILWLIWLDSIDPEDSETDWNQLNLWAQKISDNSEFEFEAIGVNMLFQKSKNIAENDLNSILIPSIFILIGVMYVIIRDWKVCAVTIGSVGLVITAEIGIMSALGMDISIIDAIAFPIILAVAVDGAFWYSKSSRERNEVRSLLLLAMFTTIAAVSLSIWSPIKAQNTLALLIIIGVTLDWLVTRFVLEDFYISRRRCEKFLPPGELISSENQYKKWLWPLSLTFLAMVAVISPPGVEVFDVNQFLADDDPELEKFDELQAKYLIASSTVTWIVIEIEGESHEDYLKVVTLQKQIGQHPSVISFETGVYETPLVMGIPFGYENDINSTIDSIAESDDGTPILDDHRLQDSGKTTGLSIAVFIDGNNADAALEFQDDVNELIEVHEINGFLGGELVTGASLAKQFDDTRIIQILTAGTCVFFISVLVSRNPERAIRIAIGTVAVGAAVDGFASIIGDRGVSTAPAVLLGMGFAADYLSHASAGHHETRSDVFARWGAAITSVSIFILLSFAEFPPAKQTGQLLTISIVLSVILASCLALITNHPNMESEE